MKPIPMHIIPQIFNCFLFRNYSAIACNEMAQAEATIARNSMQLRATEFQLVNLKNMIFKYLKQVYTVHALNTGDQTKHPFLVQS